MEKEKPFTNEGTGIPNWNPIFGMGIQRTEVNCSSKQLPNCFFNPNSVNPMDQFGSTLSSIVSSPESNSHPGIQFPGCSENIVLGELIGRLGSICNNGNISPNNSCYNTPLNSPPKVNKSITDHQINKNSPIPENHQFPPAQFAKFSTFGGKIEINHGMESRKISRVSSNQSFKTVGSQFTRIPEEYKKFSKLSVELGDSMEESSVSETEIKGQGTSTHGRKRKGKETQSSTKNDKVMAEVEKEESDAKRSKSNEKSTDPPKDYIHVRARRGQATDSHSLAERVRREKISERMKILQDLVPGCNKVTGKAVMLDEIINYVQSLQRQVEFLSMKLATVNPRMDESMEALLCKDMFRPQVSVPNNVNPFDTSSQSFPYGFQSQINGMIPDRPENHFSMNPLVTAIHSNSIIKPSHIDGFSEVSTFWENDLQSVVKMALGRDQAQAFHGQMKVEL